MDKHKRLVGLDLVKVLGAYLVILYHLTFRITPDIFGEDVPAMIRYFLTTFLSICVPLFFTASGALSLSRPMSLRRNTLRALHIAVLTVIWIAFSLLVIFLLRHEWPGLSEALAIGTELRVGYIQHIWYLPAFLFATLLLPVLWGLKRHALPYYRYGVWLLAILTFGNFFLNDLEYLLRWITGHTGYSGTRQFFWYVNFFSGHYWWIPVYLALGAYLVEHREFLQKYRLLALVGVPMCMLLLMVFALARSHVLDTVFDPVYYNYGNPFTLILTGCVTLLLLGWEPGGLVKVLAKSVADCSLGIYLLHWLLIEVLLDYAPSIAYSVLLSPISALVIFLLSWGMTWCCLHLPLVKNLFTAAPGWLRKFQ